MVKLAMGMYHRFFKSQIPDNIRMIPGLATPKVNILQVIKNWYSDYIIIIPIKKKKRQPYA